MIVRPATADDVSGIVRTIVAVAPEGTLGVEAPIDVEERSERHRRTLAEPGAGGAWVLVEDDGSQVGHLFALDSRPGILSIAMALLPVARGRGGGLMLLERAIEHGRARGAHKLTLEVWTDNARAIALYVRAGFEVEGVLRDHYRRKNGSVRSSMIMGLRLPQRSG